MGMRRNIYNLNIYICTTFTALTSNSISFCLFSFVFCLAFSSPSGYRDGRHPACTLDECALRRDEKRGLCKKMEMKTPSFFRKYKSQSPLKSGVSARETRSWSEGVKAMLVSIPSEKRGLCKGTALTYAIACEICRFA